MAALMISSLSKHMSGNTISLEASKENPLLVEPVCTIGTNGQHKRLNHRRSFVSYSDFRGAPSVNKTSC